MSTNNTDEHIVAQVQAGDKEKFGILMERYNAKLIRYGKKFISDTDSIEDNVQDIFIKTFKYINNFDTTLKFSSWIYRIAHNTFVNELKKQKSGSIPYFDLDVFVPHQSPSDPVVDEYEKKQMKQMIDIGLEDLKPKYKEVIILHYIEDFSYKEIADILQVPLGTVGIRVMRGKEMLRKFYEKNNIKYER